jgi:hypothetical protein
MPNPMLWIAGRVKAHSDVTPDRGRGADPLDVPWPLQREVRRCRYGCYLRATGPDRRHGIENP